MRLTWPTQRCRWTRAARVPVTVALCAAALLHPAGAQAGEVASQSYTQAGEHAFVVPPGVMSVQVTLVGGHGGAGNQGQAGGVAATATATIAVTPGETLYAEVAGNGAPATASGEGLGGYGGGNIGGEVYALFSGAASGGGGGGASDVRTCSTAATGCQSLSSRLIVAAGGGGGGGGGYDGAAHVAGGPGGSADISGNNGANDGTGDAPGTGGGRATSSAAGTGGTGVSGGAGTLGAGGEGALTAFVGGGGGGGGGGIYGGGGGGGGLGNTGTGNGSGGGGGGGGSSTEAPLSGSGVSGFSLLPTGENAEPRVTFAWTRPAPAVLTGSPSAVTSSSATLTGTVNPNDSQITACQFTISPAPPRGPPSAARSRWAPLGHPSA